MEIWILDDDIAASFEIKEKVKHYLKGRTGKTRFEVFHSVEELIESWELALKRKKEKPDLSILEFLIHQEIILEKIPKEFFENGRILFCTSAGFGGYQRYCQEKGLQTSSFIEKSQVPHKLDKFLEGFLADQEGFDAGLKRKLSACLAKMKSLEDLYYEAQELPEERVFELAGGILKEVVRHQCAGLEKATAGFMELQGRKEIKGPRLKKDLRDLLSVFTQFKSKHQLEER